ncbi:MAG: hypothetical protein M3Q27_13540 [Actinomycetota bacterium]|nr:hypothetical protein [Actinomycetota bacterium]
MPDQHRRPVHLPPHVIAAIASGDDSELAEADLRARLHECLAALPDDERAAVVAAHGYGEGPVGAAMEVGCEVGEGADLAQEGLRRLRDSMRD